MHRKPFLWIIMILMVLLDIYFFQALKVVAAPANELVKAIIYTGYWLISLSALVLFFSLPYLQFSKQAKLIRTTVFALISGLFFSKIAGSLFFMVDDIRRGFQWMGGYFQFFNPGEGAAGIENDLSRSQLLSWAGLFAGGGLFGTLLIGFSNKHRYKVKRIKLNFPNLPASFRGLKIVHISDIHAGSFKNKKAVQEGVHTIRNEQADLILFTGDLVNNVSGEMDGYIELFSQLQAPMGVFAVLGNHDYGDYMNWDSPEAKKANLDQLKEIYKTMNWKLLLNEHFHLQKGEDKIALIGVENWSAKARFSRYGDLNKAYSGAAQYPFKILMSHDPSHWKAEVIEKYPDIDLVLSGHTHGMQFGVEVPGFKWSPVQYMYKEWAGLYEAGSQKLYVNRGFGFLGYPGRVGIMPEITVLELV